VSDLSARLRAVVDALPLAAGLRVLEIGCGPGAAAREIARRVHGGHVLGIDRSARAIAQAEAARGDEQYASTLAFRQSAIEDFRLAAGEDPYDLAFAVRVGALDGRHPADRALAAIRAALAPHARLFIERNGALTEHPR
jgi:SAM-dependent methyltransferase